MRGRGKSGSWAETGDKTEIITIPYRQNKIVELIMCENFIRKQLFRQIIK